MSSSSSAAPRQVAACGTQFRALFAKNLTLARRNLTGSLGQCLAGVVVCAILSSFQFMSDAVLDTSTPAPPATPVRRLAAAHCDQPGPGPCNTLVYGPAGQPWVENVVAQLAAQNGLRDADIVPLPNATKLDGSWCLDNYSHPIPAQDYIPLLHLPQPAFLEKALAEHHLPLPCAYFRDAHLLHDYLLAYPNRTQNAVLFTSAYINLPPGLPAGTNLTVGYDLFFNISISRFPLRGNDHSLELMRALDSAVLALRTGNPDAAIAAEYAPFPTPPSRISNYDVVAQAGGIWFFLPAMIQFFSVFVDLVSEKELKLRIGLRFQGMSISAYWTAWFAVGFLIAIISTSVLILTAWLCNYAIFVNTDLIVLVAVFFTFALSMVAMAFFFAALVDKRKQAQTIGYAVILVGFVFQTIICTGYGSLIDLLFSADVAWWVTVIRYILQCYPPFNLAKSFFCISDIAGKQFNYHRGSVTTGGHFSWSDALKVRQKTLLGHPVTIPPLLDSVYLMLANLFAFLLLAWYLDNVLPSETGNVRHPLFCFRKAYWCRSRRSSGETRHRHRRRRNSSSSVVGAGKDPADAGASDPPEQASIRLRGAVKEYAGRRCCCCGWRSGRPVRAVDGISHDFEEGKITVLLGHNGAGKSSLIATLTGVSPLSGGEASVYGHSVTDAEAMAQIQALSGVCPQHDILWPNLTATEHGRLFATIKGVPQHEVAGEVARALAFVGLQDVADDVTKTFSGGMQRRLSVALATLGQPKFIVLDEPTTGMDPLNRRAVWTLIQSLRKSRTIIVTTHHMLEADCLGDEIIVMAKGRSAADGTPLALKRQHGAGYTLSVVLQDGVDVGVVESKLAAIVPSVRAEEIEGRAVKFVVPRSELPRFPLLLRELETLHGQAKPAVSEWGCSDSTLESAFLHITSESGFTYKTSRGDKKVMIGEHSRQVDAGGKSAGAAATAATALATAAVAAAAAPGGPSSASPARDAFWAIMCKNAKLVMRQRCQSVCQILTPVLVMALLFLLQQIIKTQIPDDTSKNMSLPAIPYPLNDPALASVLTQNDQAGRYGTQCLEFFLASSSDGVNATELLAALNDPDRQRNCTLDPHVGPPAAHHHHHHHPPGPPTPGPNATVVKVPFWLPQPDGWPAVQAELFQNLDTLNKLSPPALDDDENPVNFRTADGAVDFLDVSLENLEYRFSVNDASVALYHRNNGFSRLASRYASLYDGDVTLLIPQGKLALMSMVNDAFVYSVAPPPPLTPIDEDSDIGNQVLAVLEQTLGLKIASTMPMVQTESILGIVEIFGSFLYPMALTLQLPLYLFLIVLDKETRVRELSKIQGMPMAMYWIATVCFNMVLFVCVIVFFWVSGLVIELRFFSQTSWAILLALFLLWGLALSSFALLLASVISSSRVSTVVGYCVVLFGNGVALILSDGIYGDIPNLSVASKMPTWLFLNPQFAMVRAVYKLNFSCAAKLACYESLAWDSEVTVALAFLLFDAIWMTLAALYLDSVVPSEYGVPKHPCWCLRSSSSSSSSSSCSGNGAPVAGSDSVDGEDDDVRGERSRVAGLLDANDGTIPVITQNLRKVYGQTKAAVASFTLAVNKGEVLGLLGENGAGKSTFFSLLIGLIPPTSGFAQMASFDIATQIDQAHKKTGFCPQHDVLLDTLSCREHLEYFAQLKGVARDRLPAHVDAALKDVGLYKVQHRFAGQLSGGMKRRLQIAIAFVGESAVVLLDEPTTGLDPASRRAIWAIVDRARSRADRAILLSTHLMDEAESLSTRIAIMTHGRVRCVSGQQRLKSKLGGYKITANFQEKAFDAVSRLVAEVVRKAANDPEVGSCDLIQRFDGQATWQFGRAGGVSVSGVFEELQNTAAAAGITDWTLGQVGLDDVFAFVVAQHPNPNK